MIHDSVLELIGSTPMVRLNSVGSELSSEIVVKIESSNQRAASRTGSRST